MTLEPVLVLWSDPVADQILLHNIWSYPIVLSALCYRLMHFYCSDPGYKKQGCEDNVVYIM